MTESTGVNTWTPDQMLFQAWLSLPSSCRDPKSQKSYAAAHGVAEETLSRWKRLPGWHDAVYDLALSHVLGDLVPVLHAQVVQAKKGSLPHAQWLFEVAGKWSPKQRLEHSGSDGAPLVFTIAIDRKDDDDVSGS